MFRDMLFLQIRKDAECFSHLTFLLIESDLLHKTDFGELIAAFAVQKHKKRYYRHLNDAPWFVGISDF